MRIIIITLFTLIATMAHSQDTLWTTDGHKVLMKKGHYEKSGRMWFKYSNNGMTGSVDLERIDRIGINNSPFQKIGVDEAENKVNVIMIESSLHDYDLFKQAALILKNMGYTFDFIEKEFLMLSTDKRPLGRGDLNIELNISVNDNILSVRSLAHPTEAYLASLKKFAFGDIEIMPGAIKGCKGTRIFANEAEIAWSEMVRMAEIYKLIDPDCKMGYKEEL